MSTKIVAILVFLSGCTYNGAEPPECDFGDAGPGVIDITNVCVCVQKPEVDAGTDASFDAGIEYRLYTCR